jgi:hypothetical protein
MSRCLLEGKAALVFRERTWTDSNNELEEPPLINGNSGHQTLLSWMSIAILRAPHHLAIDHASGGWSRLTQQVRRYGRRNVAFDVYVTMREGVRNAQRRLDARSPRSTAQ